MGRGCRFQAQSLWVKPIFKAQHWVLAGLDTEGTLPPPPQVKSLPRELKPVPQPFCRGRQNSAEDQVSLRGFPTPVGNCLHNI